MCSCVCMCVFVRLFNCTWNQLRQACAVLLYLPPFLVHHSLPYIHHTLSPFPTLHKLTIVNSFAHTLGNMCRESEKEIEKHQVHFALLLLLQQKLRRCFSPAPAGVCVSRRCQSKSKRKIAPLDCCVVFKIGRKKKTRN